MLSCCCLFSGPSSNIHVPASAMDNESNYVREDNFTCGNCDKMYTKHRDLEIHMSYCTG